MAEHYRFFDQTVEDQVTYEAKDYAEYFHLILSNGVFNDGNSLQVSTDETNMTIQVDTGYAFINGYMYKNDATLNLTHDTADATQDRIDRIVVKLDTTNRQINTVIKKGTKSDNPVPPTLSQTDTLYEISLAQIVVTAGKSFIASEQIIDERMDNNVCGWVSSLVEIPINEMWDDWNIELSNIQDEWTTWFNSTQNDYSQLDLNQLQTDFDNHIAATNPHNITLASLNGEPAFTKNSGFNLDKSDSYTSLDSNTLATSKAVKSAYDRAVSAENTSKSYTDTHENKSNPHGLTTGSLGAEPAFTKNSGFNLDKSDSTTSTSSITLATSDAVRTAYMKAVSAQDDIDSHSSSASPHSGHVKGTIEITVSATAPSNPSTNDIWIDISQ